MDKPLMITERVYNIPMENREILQKYADERTDIIDLAIGNPDLPTPKYIVDKTKEAVEQGFTRYTEYYGTPELKIAIAERYKKKNNLVYEDNTEIIITQGVMEGIFVCIQSLIDEGDEIIIPTPHYAPYEQATICAKGKAVFVELKEKDNYRLDPEQLEKAITSRSKAIIFSNPSNPLGDVWTKEDLQKIADVAKRHNLIVISDEIYDELIDVVYPGSIATLEGMRERTLVLNGFSKTYCMAGYRVGYILGPETMISQIKKIHYSITLCPNSISQKAALAALSCPKAEIDPIKETFSRRRKITFKELACIPKVKCFQPKGGMFVLPNFKAYKMDAIELAKFLVQKAGVIVLPASGPGQVESYLRLSMCASEDQIIEAIRRMKKVLAELA